MALKQATIQVSPHISVTGTMMTMAMMIDPPAKGMTKVMCNGQVFEGKLLGKPWPMILKSDPAESVPA